ncbi:MAG: ADP-forming succinate--CoA ligase subunit beta [Actinomycetota bacterium]
MDLLEFQGKELFARWGIPVPEGRVARTPEEAASAARAFGGRVAVKAQVRVGGRGKAGGIKVAKDPTRAHQAAAGMLGTDLRGERVSRVLVERAFDIEAEYYAAVTLDRTAGAAAFMVSSKGGVDIEEVTATEPEAITRVQVDPLLGLADFQVRTLVYGAGLGGHTRAGELLAKLYRLFIEADASLVEVNPLALTDRGDLLALDSKVSLDDSALYRHPEHEDYRESSAEDSQEVLARVRGLNYIRLDGFVGVIGNGAGLVMATLDLVDQAGGRAADFLDVGGGAGAEVLFNALEVVLSDSRVRSVLINVFGGITRCDLVARGIVEALDGLAVEAPIVVRLDGTNAEEGRAILARAKHPKMIAAPTMVEAARRAVEAAR